MKLYIDESGNTGSNWLDSDQPYFVYGGWLISDEKCEQAKKRINEIFAFSKARELKSKAVLSNKRQCFFQMMDCMIDEMGALPVFVVADKKYMVACKIVETFFDSAYNPNINTYLTARSPLKKALADLISSEEKLLRKFEALLTTGTMDMRTMEDVRDDLAEIFAKNNVEIVSKAISPLTDINLTAMIDEYSSASMIDCSKYTSSLTTPLLMQIIINIGSIENYYNDKVEICADTILGYNNVFREIEAICKSEKIVKNIDNITFYNSKGNRLIQAADLLSGYVARSFRDIDDVAAEPDSQKLWKRLIALRDVFVEQGIVIWDYDAHSDFIENILKLAGGHYCYDDNPRDIIATKFHKAIKS